jgi:hypothetical protein
MKFRDIVILREKPEGTFQKYLVRLPVDDQIDDERVSEEIHFKNGIKIRITRPRGIEITEEIKNRILHELEIRENFGTIDSTINIPLPNQIKSEIVENIAATAHEHTVGSFMRFLTLAINGANHIGKPAETIDEFFQNFSAGIQTAIENAVHAALKKFNPT